MFYKKYEIKPYAVIRYGAKYSVTAPDGTHVGSAVNLSEARFLVNYDIHCKEKPEILAEVKTLKSKAL